MIKSIDVCLLNFLHKSHVFDWRLGLQETAPPNLLLSTLHLWLNVFA